MPWESRRRDADGRSRDGFAPRRQGNRYGQIMEKLFEIVHEDDDLLVINKPAGLVCHPTKGGVHSSLISRARWHLGVGMPPHLINRLDRETSGLVMVAKNSDTASELGKIWESRAVRKEYLAIVHGWLDEAHSLIMAPLGKDERSRIAIKDTVRPDGAFAQTEFWVERRFTQDHRQFTLGRAVPLTGRKHQIRIHLAHRGHPIVGDKLYGGDEDLYLALVQDRLTDQHRRQLLLPYHALHAGEVRFRWRGEERVFRAGPEPWFKEFIEAGTEHSVR